MEESRPLISICCLTYNHKNYIKDALDGFLAQKIDCPIEILIHDDASSDGTADIIREYEAIYPEIIFPIYQTENQHIRGGKPGKINRDRAKGKYIAICEGDDFWTDPYKLQKQVDFLEANNDYGLVYTGYRIRMEFSSKPDKDCNTQCYSGDVLLNLIKHNFIATLTVCFRRDLLKLIDIEEIYEKKFLMTDYPIWIQIAKNSKVFYLTDITSTYRFLPESLSHSKSFAKQERFYLSSLQVQVHYLKKYNLCGEIDIDDIIFSSYLMILRTCFFYNNYEKAKEYVKKVKSRGKISKIELFLISNKFLFGFASWVLTRFKH